MPSSCDKKILMIFSGYNQRAIFAFLRYISGKCDDYVIVACSEDDDILKSSYRNKVIYIRKNRQLQLEELLTVIDTVKAKEIVIMPTTEALNRFLLDNRDVFLQHRCTVPLVEKSLYQEISDKSSFYDLCKENGIPVPGKRILSTSFDFPYVAKSPKYFNKCGETISPILVTNEEEHNAFLSREDYEEFDIQEFIEGESFYLLYYFDKSGNVRKFSQKNLLQQPGGKSILAAISADIHKEAISLLYERLFMKKNFYGLVMVEVRKKNGTYYMIEANPRFWGPSQLFVDAGVDFFGLLLGDCGIDIETDSSEKCSVYYWGGGRSVFEVWLESGKDIFEREKPQFISADVYNREDSIEIYKSEGKMDKIDEKKLKELMELKSKHSQYQRLPSCLESILSGPVVGKYEEERMNYICDNVELKGNVIDIGGNTGYFTFEAITRGNADHVDYYEGNNNHSEFVKLAADYLGLSSRISVFNEYYVADESTRKYDVGFYLNVVHHLGKDYICGIDVEEAKKRMMNELNTMSDYIKILVFQMGYNWGGDIAYCLFDKGTKEEMIDFVTKGTNGHWNLKSVGIAVIKNGKTVYEEINDDNCIRMDSLGEFRNRPLFILESVSY